MELSVKNCGSHACKMIQHRPLSDAIHLDVGSCALQTLIQELELLDVHYISTVCLRLDCNMADQKHAAGISDPSTSHSDIRASTAYMTIPNASTATSSEQDQFQDVAAADKGHISIMDNPLALKAGSSQRIDSAEKLELRKMSLHARMKHLAFICISPVLAVECQKEEGCLWIVPTHSRITRRVPYDSSEPIAHLDL